MAKAQPKKSEVAQIGRFGLVGILNTLLDFAIFNLLTSSILGMGAAWAGIISGTVAMINSFVFNQRFTFKAKHTPTNKVVAFFAITIFGIYVIRPIVIAFFTKTWLWPSQTLYSLTSKLGLSFSADFDQRNLALLGAIFVVLFYNYILYKKFVFNDK